MAVGLMLNVLAFALIGAGPAWILLHERGPGAALLLSPTAGFALTAVFGTAFTACDIPVSQWAAPWLVVGGLVSLACCLARPLTLPDAGVLRQRAPLALAGFALTGILLVAPQLAGGLHYSVFRGNGEDSFNYVATAGYLDREPISWADRVDRQTLVERHQSYERVRQLLNARWTSSALLAFSCRIAGVPLYRFEYAYSLLSFLLAYAPAVLLALAAGSGCLPAVALAVVIATGFWGQLVLDMRAVSQINSVPVLLLLALLVVWIEDLSGPGIRWRLHILLGLVAGALILLYPEIVPMTGLGLAIFFGVRILRGEFRFRTTAGYVASMALALAAGASVAPMLIRFVSHQFTYAASGVNTWHRAYFGWLYSDPLTGIWGLAPFAHEPRAARFPVLVLLQRGSILFGLILTALLAAAILSLWGFRGRKPRAAATIAAALGLAAILQFGYLALRGQLWAAGKSLAFGYPYLLLLVSSFVLASVAAEGHWRGRLRRGARACLGLWMASQILLAVIRVPAARFDIDYANYLQHHGEYRRHNWDLTALTHALREHSGATVWYHASNPWVGDYVGLVLGWHVKLKGLLPARDGEVIGALRPRLNRSPDFIITTRPGFAHGALARSGELALFDVRNGGRPVILDIENPNGIEGEPTAPFLWLGGSRTSIRLVSTASGCAVFRARFTLGPSAPKGGTALLLSSTAGGSGRLKVDRVVSGFRLPVNAGINEITAEVADRPAAFLPDDKRPLMVRVDGLHVQTLAPAPTVPAACPIAVR